MKRFDRMIFGGCALYSVFQLLKHGTGTTISIDQDLHIEDILYGEPTKIDTTKTTNIVPSTSTWWRGTGDIQNATHPHLGARYWKKDGEPVFQMIVDPSPKRLGIPQKNFADSISPVVLCPTNSTGIEQEKGNEVLRKVRRGIEKYRKMVPGKEGRRPRKSRILCMIYTVDLPKSRASLKAQSETWGRKCDGFLAASNVTDHSLGAIDLVHDGPEEYGNMWQKIRSMWAYAYDHYLDDYDFFHIAGDDVFMVIENLRSFLDGPDVLRLENGYLDEISSRPEYRKMASKWASSDFYHGVHGLSSRPLYFGTPAKYKGLFPCGGPGYTLNRAALQFFGMNGVDSHHSEVRDSREDVFIGGWFEKQGLVLSHVHDRFNATRVGSSALWIGSEKKNVPMVCPGVKFLRNEYGLVGGKYVDGISEEFLSFHLKDEKPRLNRRGHTMADLIYQYHAVLYGLCEI